MICPGCQNQLPDGSVACNKCGLMFNYQPQPQQQMYQQPYQQSQYQNTSPAQPKKSIKKLVIGLVCGIIGLLVIAIAIPLIIMSLPKEIDYGDAESLEAALNDGDDCVGKIVKFKVTEVKPNSFFGYNLWAGEHLNFVSSSNPGVKKGGTITVKITKVDSTLGSWMIRYKRVNNASEGKNTIKSD
jgi:hypothetical protein